MRGVVRKGTKGTVLNQEFIAFDQRGIFQMGVAFAQNGQLGL